MMARWIPPTVPRLDLTQDRMLEWLRRSFDGISQWTTTVEDATQQAIQFIGGYDASTNLVQGGTYNGQVLPTAATLNAGDYFLVLVGGTLSTLPNAPEINGQSVAVNDKIISDGAAYILLTATTDFLSKVVDDSAAGVITLSAGGRSGLVSPAASDELTRKDYVDAGDNAVQGNLDTHIGHLYSGPSDPHGISAHVNDADIHFSDAPNDGEHYARRNLGWVAVPPPNLGALYGATNSFTMGTASTVLDGYADSGANGSFVNNVFDTSGLIIIPAAGLYRVNAWVFGTQGSSTKEETMRLGLRIVNTIGLDGDFPKWAFDVATDKTNERSFHFSQILNLPQMAFLFLYMSATTGMGTFTVVDTTFEVEEVTL